MSKAITFDTLAYSKKLLQAGFTQLQAEVQTEALAEIIEDKLASKQDLKDLEYRLTIRVGAMLAATIAIIVSLLKFL